MKTKIKKILYIIRFILISIGVKWNDIKLQKDIIRWKHILNLKGNNYMILAELLFEYSEFRNLFIYRNRYRIIYRSIIRLFYKPMSTLYLQSEEIGGGLFIQHGFSTMVSAKSIGENCWINQQVTIGYNGRGEPPIIEDNVMITCGAKVLGSITVSCGAVIGANAVVLKDVEPNATMVGIPARRVH